MYTKVISLGPSCETAFQIRQIIQQEEAYVFDWVISSAQTVAKAIRTDFRDFIRPEGLSLKSGANLDHPFITDSLTGIEFHHDFNNNHDFMIGLPNVQQKYDFLIDRFRRVALSDAVVLFIHARGTQDDASLLDVAISERFPALSYKLLTLGISERAGSDEARLIFRAIPGYGQTWQDRTPQWAEVLDELLNASYGKTLTQRPVETREGAPK